LKRFLTALFVVILCYTGYLYHHDERALPPLQNGDIIFQTSWTNQSIAIGLASTSLFIHTGIIKQTPQGFSVIEAGDHVHDTPLIPWIHRGILSRFSIYRYAGLQPEQTARIVTAATAYYGEPYNMYFSFEKGSMYCSELVYTAYKDAGIPLGKVEKISELNINNRFTKEIIETRWHNYPACRDHVTNFEQCYNLILNGDIITPSSLAHDAHLARIFDNYPW